VYVPTENILSLFSDGIYFKLRVCSSSGKALFKITLQIQRVQNIILYQQYQLKKRFLEEQKTTLPNGWPLERDLWHGTKKSNTESIAMHGFDRSYAGMNGKF